MKATLQIDPQWFRSDPTVRGLSHSLRGVYVDVRALLALTDSPGVIRVPLAQIAAMLPCGVEQLVELVRVSLVEGVDAGECESVVHVDRVGRQVELVADRVGPLWFCRPMLAAEYLRQRASEAGRKGGGNPVFRQQSRTFKGAPKGAPGAPRGSPPHSPPPTPGNLSAAGAATAAPPPRRARKSERVRTDEEHRIRREFITWFVEICWPAHVGRPYDFDATDPQLALSAADRARLRGMNYSAAWKVFDHELIGLDLERAKQVAECFARTCATTGAQYQCPLMELARHALKWWNLSQLKTSNTPGPRISIDRGGRAAS